MNLEYSMKKPLALAALATGLLTIAATAWWLAAPRDDDRSLVLHGNVDIRQVALAFEGSGRVRQLYAEEGDRVAAGARLALLDTRTLALQAEQAQAQIDVQQQALLLLRNGSRPEEIVQARSRLAAAEADAARAEHDHRRLRGVAAKNRNNVSEQALERAATTQRMAQAYVVEQREALRLAELGPRAEEVAAAEARLRAAEAQLALLRHQIAEGELRAPSNGVVRSRLLEVGDMASPQRPVFALALADPKWVRVYVGEPDLGRVKPGMAARVTTDSSPDQPISGRVGYIASVAEFTPKSVQTEELRTSLVYEVRVLVEDPADALRLGQPATVRLGGAAPR